MPVAFIAVSLQRYGGVTAIVLDVAMGVNEQSRYTGETSALTWNLYGINIGTLRSPAAIKHVAEAAEAAGEASLWVSEHVVLPGPLIALTGLVVHTCLVRPGSGGIIPSQRNPLVLEKELASLDALAEGRLIVDVGAGLSRTGVACYRCSTITGNSLISPHIQAYPRSAQQPTPRIVIGGHSAAARHPATEERLACHASTNAGCADGRSLHRARVDQVVC